MWCQNRHLHIPAWEQWFNTQIFEAIKQGRTSWLPAQLSLWVDRLCLQVNTVSSGCKWCENWKKWCSEKLSICIFRSHGLMRCLLVWSVLKSNTRRTQFSSRSELLKPECTDLLPHYWIVNSKYNRFLPPVWATLCVYVILGTSSCSIHPNVNPS